jgi:hypothetical protein
LTLRAARSFAALPQGWGTPRPDIG